MSDLFLGIADPEFWRNCGYALLAIGLSGTVAVIVFLDRKRRLQKGLALLFLAVVLAGLGVARFGNNALLSEARERAREAELELAKLKTPRTLTPEGQRRVAAALQKFAGQEFEGQVAPGSEDARPLWEELDKSLRAQRFVVQDANGVRNTQTLRFGKDDRLVFLTLKHTLRLAQLAAQRNGLFYKDALFSGLTR